jgi:hypothetical protein
LLLIGHMPGSSIVNLYVTIYSDFLISSEFTLIYCRNISCIRIMCVLPIYVIYLLGPFVFHLVDYLNCFFITTHPVICHHRTVVEGKLKLAAFICTQLPSYITLFSNCLWNCDR